MEENGEKWEHRDAHHKTYDTANTEMTYTDHSMSV